MAVIPVDTPVLLAPHDDRKAAAFADLLGHIDDGGDMMLVDEKAALAVAEKYRCEKQAAHIAFDENDLLDEFAVDEDDAPPPLDSALDEAPTALTDAEIDAVLGDDPFGDESDGEGQKHVALQA